MSKFTHKKYLSRLKENNISVYPIEQYIGMINKILHKCICGNEWSVSPVAILANQKCGCTRGKTNTNTHDEYLTKLKEKNIKVYPLEDYKDSTTKILHRCVCGNEWSITPNNALNNYKCGCIRGDKQTHSHDEYLTKLKEKGIGVYPLEEYIGYKSKILHRCVCGNEWSVTPTGVISGNKCGCKRRISFRNEEFYKDKVTVLYYIKIGNLYKIGVTLFKDSIETSLKVRFGKLQYVLLQADIFEDGAEAFRLEQSIINSNIKHRYLGEDILKSGNTELFIEDIR